MPPLAPPSPQSDDPSVKHASQPSPLVPPALVPVPASPNAAAAAAAAAAGAPGAPAALFVPPMSSPAGVLPMQVQPLRPAAFSPVTNLRDNLPCNTLFM